MTIDKNIIYWLLSRKNKSLSEIAEATKVPIPILAKLKKNTLAIEDLSIAHAAKLQDYAESIKNQPRPKKISKSAPPSGPRQIEPVA